MFSNPDSCTRRLAFLKRKMTKAERAAAAQEGVSAFEVELLQKECISLKDAPQDRDCCHVGALNIDFPVWKT